MNNFIKKNTLMKSNIEANLKLIKSNIESNLKLVKSNERNVVN